LFSHDARGTGFGSQDKDWQKFIYPLPNSAPGTFYALGIRDSNRNQGSSRRPAFRKRAQKAPAPDDLPDHPFEAAEKLANGV